MNSGNLYKEHGLGSGGKFLLLICTYSCPLVKGPSGSLQIESEPFHGFTCPNGER